MHKIIGAGLRGRRSLGRKALNLVNLDKSGLVPDFVIISSEVFKKALSSDQWLSGYLKETAPAKADLSLIRKRILSWSVEPAVLSQVKKSLKSMNIVKFLVRSSFVSEDTERMSCAGVFPTYLSEDTSRLEPLIKKLWASQFSEEFLRYQSARGEAKSGMDALIQRYVRPDYGGTAFFDLERAGEAYVEYYRGGNKKSGKPGGNKYVFLEKNGFSYFNDNEVELEHSGWLLRLTERLSGLRAGFGARFVYFEFVLSAGRIYVVQARGGNAGVTFADSLFKFENECRYNYHYTDFSDREAAAIFRAVGLHSRMRSEITGGGLFVRYAAFEAIEAELKEKAKSAEFVSGFHSHFLAFILDEAKKTKSLDKKDTRTLFQGLKKINLKLSVFNYLYTRILKFSLEFLLSREGRESFDGYYEYFLSAVPAALKRFFSDLDNAPEVLCRLYSPEVIRGLKRDGNLRKAAVRFAEKDRSLAKKFYCASPEAKAFWEALRSLVALKNDANPRFFVINSIYAERIALLEKNVKKAEIQAICRIPAESIDKLLKERRTGRKAGVLPPTVSKKEKAGAARLSAEFPLRGVTAQEGRASGVVRIVKADMRHKDVGGGDILVAAYLDSSFLVPMLLCKGIIAAKGGLTSHAALIAREMKKPCIVGVHGCTDILRNGDKVRIAGGKVYRV